MQRFFPNPRLSGASNPIKNENIYQIPSDETNWFYLEKHQSETVAETTKTLHVLISPWRASDIEDLDAKIHDKVDGADLTREERVTIIDNFIARLSRRKHSGIKSIYYHRFSFLHGG
jgi:hypothetical protein